MENVSASPSASVALKETTLVAPSSTTKLPGSVRTGALLGTAGADAPPPPPPHALNTNRTLRANTVALVSTKICFSLVISLSQSVQVVRYLAFLGVRPLKHDTVDD